MKLRLLAMATVCAAALSTPALAGQGWYLGLGGGYDNQQAINLKPNSTAAFAVGAQDSGIGVLAIGYKWTSGWRLENEIGYTSHTLSTPTTLGRGNDAVASDMLNILYDFPLSDQWSLTLGGGAGIGALRAHINTNPVSNLDYLKGSQ